MPPLHLATFGSDITPPLGHPLCGGWIEPVRGVDDPLRALGVVLLGGEKPVVICVVDWVAVRNEAFRSWRKALADAAHTTPECVHLHAVHPHNAPFADTEAQRLIAAAGAPASLDLAFFDDCVKRSADALKAALPRAQRFTHVGTGSARVTEVASNRRIVIDGQARFSRTSATKSAEVRDHPEGLVDPLLRTLSFWDGDRPRAALHFYACHPMSYYGDGRVSADFCGLARQKMQDDLPDVFQIYLNGCGGNVTAGKYNDGARQNRAILRDRMHAAMTTSWRATTRTAVDGFDWRTEAVKLPPRREASFGEAASRAVLNDATATAARRNNAAFQLAWLKRIDTPIELGCLDFGGRVMSLHLPGEAFVEYQLAAQRMRPDATVCVAAYGDDGPGYIPTARAFLEGGYEPTVALASGKPRASEIPAMMRQMLPALFVVATAAAQPPALKNGDPRTPADERTTFELAAGFTIDLVASEPDVVDPVAMCFDERGRVYVCEMRGYPNGGVGTGNESRGRIRRLEDRDGDGRFETATTFAEGLRFPMGVTPWQGGIIAAVAPDLLYLKDTDGDGKADVKRVLYTGFNLANIQQMVNGLQWGLDNWVYGICGSDGGVVKSAEKADAPEVNLRNRGFRFKPWVPGSLEPTSSGGQYGLTADDYGHWFTATNSQHLRQIVLPDHYLRRNPYLAVTAVTLDIPEHGAAAKVFRSSPFEAWRVERTTRRAGSPDAKRFPTTELVPGGFITSACSPLIYTADLFPEPYRGNNFVCDPANNLIHRETLHGKGAVFTAKRADANTEFLRSTDNWFRPVSLTLAPDGSVYVLDFYREVIETPLSLPDDIKARLNLESRGRGRIWRIAPAGFKAAKLPDVSGFDTKQLVGELLTATSARRLTAQRLLVERRPGDLDSAIPEDLGPQRGKPTLVNVVWSLHGTGNLSPRRVHLPLGDPNPGVREQAVRAGEALFGAHPQVLWSAAELANDPDPRVRFQVAMSAGAMPRDAAVAALGDVLKGVSDAWTQTAVLASAANCTPELLERQAARAAPPALLARLAAVTGAKGNEAEVVALLGRVADGKAPAADAAILDGLGQGMRNSARPLSAWWTSPPAAAKDTMARLRGRFEAAGVTVQKDGSPDRAAAAALLAFGPFDLAEKSLAPALAPTAPGDLQLAAVRTLATHTDAKVPDLLLAPWAGYSPAARREVVEALLSRPDRTLKLLDAVGKNLVSANELDPARVKALKDHPNAAVRAKAAAVLKATVNADRAKVVAEYAAALELKGDAERGRGVFKTNCSACHRLDMVGADVGANLLAALPNKSGDDLLAAVFDPNREVDPRFVNYTAVTADGRILGGVIVAETPTSVTLRRADGAEDTVLRANLESLRNTRLSLMPEGLERMLSRQDVADLFAYLRVAGK